jgi:hypothetical protein
VVICVLLIIVCKRESFSLPPHMLQFPHSFWGLELGPEQWVKVVRFCKCIHKVGYIFAHVQPWRWRLYVSSKCWHLPMSLHGTKTQKKIIFILTAVKTSYFTCLCKVSIISNPIFSIIIFLWRDGFWIVPVRYYITVLIWLCKLSNWCYVRFSSVFNESWPKYVMKSGIHKMWWKF